MNKQNKKILSPEILKWIVISLLVFVIIILIFGIGMWVGEKKARFSYRWAENYHKNFGGPKNGFFNDWQNFPHKDYIDGHGAFGEIIQLNDSDFVIKGRDDIEKIIITTENTIIKKRRKTMANELKIGDRVIVIGSPNENGQIEAKLIRIINKHKDN